MTSRRLLLEGASFYNQPVAEPVEVPAGLQPTPVVALGMTIMGAWRGVS